MSNILHEYSSIVGEEEINHILQLAKPLRKMNVVHVNSTRLGGGVAEILYKLVPFMNELGMNTEWEVIEGNEQFYICTKSFHNGLQGDSVDIQDNLYKNYEETNRKNSELLKDKLKNADIVFIHDPQPAALLQYTPKRSGKWIWRCHIDASKPDRTVWKYLRNFVSRYDASVFSLADFAQPLPHPQYLIPPSIDPLSNKNIDLDDIEVNGVAEKFGLNRDRPIMLQVSRFDRFKDPVGVIKAYKLTKKFLPSLQLVLAGGTADDDPEGAEVLKEVKEAAGDDNDIHILLLPPDAHRTINALQRLADIVLQKSIKEGFGLTVTESLWKGKPVIGGDTGGIRLQVINHYTGFCVNTPEGAALRIRYLLHNPDKIKEMGKNAKEFVRENFLITRHLREYLILMVKLISNNNHSDRIEI
jgi:trehalose synthase